MAEGTDRSRDEPWTVEQLAWPPHGPLRTEGSHGGKRNPHQPLCFRVHLSGALACAGHTTPGLNPGGCDKEALWSCSVLPRFHCDFFPCEEGGRIPPLSHPQGPGLIHFAIQAQCSSGPRNSHVTVAPVSSGFWSLRASPDGPGASATGSRPVALLLTSDRLRAVWRRAQKPWHWDGYQAGTQSPPRGWTAACPQARASRKCALWPPVFCGKR